MKNKILKKMMILGMSFSMAVSMVSGTALAAETDLSVQAEEPTETAAPETAAPETTAPETQAPETEAPATEPQTQAPETEAPATETQVTEPQTQTTEPQTQTTEPQTQTESQTQSETQTETPATEATEPTTEIESKDKKAKAISGIVAKGEPEITSGSKDTDYTETDGNYIIKGNVSMTLDDCAMVGTITVEKNGALTIKALGEMDVVGAVTVQEGGTLEFEKESTAMIRSDFLVGGTLKINGGTLIEGSTAADSLKAEEGKTPQIVVTGGSISYDIPSSITLVNASNTPLENKKVGSTMKAGKRVKVTDAQNTYNGIWTNAKGDLYLCITSGTKELTAEVYDVKLNDAGTEVSGTVDTYKSDNINTTNLNLKSGTKTYTFAAGTIISMTYGTLPSATVPATLENATIASVKITGGDSQDKFKIPDESTNIEVTDAKLKAGTYKATVAVEDTLGFKISGDIVLNVAKKTLTITKVNAENKEYDGTTKATGSLALDGVVEGDQVAVTADYNFATADAAEAADKEPTDQTVTPSNIKLDDAWADKYELASTSITGTAKITKAACKETAEKPSFFFTYSYDKTSSSWKYYLKWKALPGQEYSTNEKSWKENTSTSTKTYMLNVKDKTSTTIYTRIAETKNYLASSTVHEKIDVHKPVAVSSDKVAVEGITDGENYKTNSTLKFKAIGVNPAVSDKDLSYGDEKYLPYSWKLTTETVWQGAPYTGSIDCKQNGTYTVVISYHKYIYATNDKDKLEWTYDQNGDVVKKVVFKVSAKGKAVTTSSDGTTTTTGAGDSDVATATAAKTADTTPIVPIAGAFGASGLAALWLMRKKKYSK